LSKLRVHSRIREWRAQRPDLTQEKLAKLCAVTRQTIIALEAGRYSPSLELAFKLSRALGCTLDEVFQYSEEK
jgi:putative transcriptional regulator